MSYLTSGHQSGIDHLSSSVLHGGGGRMDLGPSMMGGGGVDMSSLGGGLGGLAPEDMLHHGQRHADTTDISMLSNYMTGTGHVTNPKAQHLTQTLRQPHYRHQFGMSMGAGSCLTANTTSGVGSGALGNGISKSSLEMSHLRRRRNELPYYKQNHFLDDIHRERDPYLFSNNEPSTNVGNILGNTSLSSQRYRSLSMLHSSSLLPEDDLIDQEIDSDWHSSRGIPISGSSRSGVASGLASSAPASHHYLDAESESPTDYLYNQRHTHQQDLQDYGMDADYDYARSSTAPLSHSQQAHTLHRPKSAPLHNSNQQYRTQQAGYATAATSSASASNYPSNPRNAKNHFSNAHNLNAHSGGPGGDHSTGFGGLPIPGVGGFLGGRGANNSTHPPQAANLFSGPGGPGGEDEVRQQSVSSESQAYYGKETMVKELRPEFVRWFYRSEQDRKWKPFTGFDSIRIERKYREVFRDQITSYTHSSYYPVASSNDESTDFSKFMHQQNNVNYNMQGNNQGMGNRYPSGNSMQRRWWPGQGPDATVDTEFNNGGPGFPPAVRTNSMGTSLFGRMGNGNGTTAVQKERMLHKANSASALLGPSSNGFNSGQGHYPDASKVVVVREGLYEVDLDSWTCFSTYWPGDTCVITRGTWFYDGTWDPLPVEQAEKLEEAHMSKFCGSALINHAQHAHAHGQGHHQEDPQKAGAAAGHNAPAIHRISFNDFHVDWTSPTDIFWYSTATSHKLMRGIGQKLGFSDWGHRICRGYYKPALIMDRPSEISHIVFVIHGIGQKMDTGRIVRNCSAFRDCVAQMKEKYFPQLNNAKQRAEFFPVEWRSAANLDGDIVEAITPQKLLTLRQLLNSTAMDIMYYTSPLYRAEIQNALIAELNRIYANFVKRNPNFVMNGGKVSVLAHSLGAVITYDIITGYLCGSVEDEISIMQQQQFHHMPRRVVHPQQGLLFTLEHFFCLGSPLSVFLALRWREPHDPNLKSQILPHHLCRRIYNVFYSSDPVAYRLEPLLNRYYAKIAPLTIHAYNAPTKPRYSDMPRERITTIATKTATDNTNNATATSTLPAIPNPFADSSAQQTQQKSIPISKPSLPSVLKPPTLPSLPQLTSPSKETNNLGGWFGGNIKKLWNGATGPAAGLLDKTGISAGLSGLTGGNQNNPPSEVPGVGPDLPSSVGGGGMGTNHPLDEASFFAQQTKDNYATVVEEEPSNIPNDLEYRLDYVLRESQFSGSTYIAALTSHTSYWNSPDAAYFVMTHLYDDLIEQTISYSGER